MNFKCCTLYLLCTLHSSPRFLLWHMVTIYHHSLKQCFISVELLSCAFLTFCSILIANDINDFMDNMDLNISNSFTHMLGKENSDN